MDSSYESEMKALFIALLEKNVTGDRARQFIEKAVGYHGFPAPGVIIGAYMVDIALEELGASPEDKLYAVAETSKCVSDSIGIITGCTSGSSKFHLFETGRLSIAIGRDEGNDTAECVRVFIDHRKTSGYHALRAWYFNEPDAKDQLPALLEDILAAGRSILSSERVTVRILQKDHDWKPTICPVCGEMIPDNMIVENVCKACGKSSFYLK